VRFELDVAVRRYHAGRVLVGGTPPTLLRLSANGAAAIDRIVEGETAVTGRAIAALVERLVELGVLHPVPERLTPEALDVTVVVPVRDRALELDRCLAALRRAGEVELVVVDDGSRDERSHRAVADRHGARLVRRSASLGPSAARNAGLEEVATRYVAFVDSDVEVREGWLEPLVALLAGGHADLVAPRVVGTTDDDGLVHRYEAAASPLDLGPRRGVVARGSRLAYVPAAAMVVRTESLRRVWGFDPALRVGEDVDLVWRLGDAGAVCRYEPSASVVHHHRTTLREMWSRRVAYGTSAAPLDRRHPGSVAPVRVPLADAVSIAASLAGSAPLAVAASASAWLRLRRRLANDERPGQLAASLVALSLGSSWRQFARAVVRPWWPASLAAALMSRRARRVVAVSAVAVPLVEYRRRRPSIDPWRWTLLWLADDVAYSAGVWRGCVTERRLGPLLAAIRQN
jgi:mycofactocin system glycosyltransferase